MEKLPEARDPDLSYTTVSKQNKVTVETDKISKVVTELKGQKSANATKLLKAFEELHQQKKEIERTESVLKEKGVDLVNSLFDDTDAVWTRVVNTASLVITLSKESVRKTEKFDVETFMKKIALLAPELVTKMNELKAECTSIKETLVSPKLDVDLKAESKFSDTFKNLYEKTKNMLIKFSEGIKKWATSYDTKLKQIEKALPIIMLPESNFMSFVDEVISESKKDKNWMQDVKKDGSLDKEAGLKKVEKLSDLTNDEIKKLIGKRGSKFEKKLIAYANMIGSKNKKEKDRILKIVKNLKEEKEQTQDVIGLKQQNYMDRASYFID